MGQNENFEFANRNRYEKALEFIAAAASLPYEKFCRLAVRNGDTLIEILQGSSGWLEFVASRQIDSKTVAAQIKDILQKIHFNSQDDYYLALLLPENADQSEISRQWKELMRIYHPDKKNDLLPAEVAAKCAARVNEIYNVLKDPMKKFSYDRQLTNTEANGQERPSEFSNSGSPLLQKARKYSFAIAFFGLMVAIISAAMIYSDKTEIKSSPAGTQSPAQTDVRKPEVVAQNETPVRPQHIQKPKTHAHAKHKIVKKYRKPAARKNVAAVSHVANVKKQPIAKRRPETVIQKKTVKAFKPADDIALADEVSDFIDKFVQAFEDGNLNAYLSFYSTSATENDSFTYGDLREFYGNLFDNGRYTYAIRNMVIRQENGTIMVSGNFETKKLPQAAQQNPVCKGTISLTLVRESGELKIVRAEKVLNVQS